MLCCAAQVLRGESDVRHHQPEPGLRHRVFPGPLASLKGSAVWAAALEVVYNGFKMGV